MKHPDPTPVQADEALRQALLALPQPAAPAEVDALAQRVLMQWHERHGRDAALLTPHRGRLAALGAGLRRQKLWVGTAGLAAVAALATAIVMTRPDPALEELMQPDVLSQMAIGEM